MISLSEMACVSGRSWPKYKILHDWCQIEGTNLKTFGSSYTSIKLIRMLLFAVFNKLGAYMGQYQNNTLSGSVSSQAQYLASLHCTLYAVSGFYSSCICASHAQYHTNLIQATIRFKRCTIHENNTISRSPIRPLSRVQKLKPIR